MTPQKRLLDVVSALFLLIVLGPLMIGVAVAILLQDGRPVLYVSERMKSPTEPFRLLKFRTMINSDQNSGVSGGDKSQRITPIGRFLRAKRLDELPQLFNVLKGDLSFVGPRPPLRMYVERFPDLYAQVLQSRPGITGLASLVYHGHEERILSACVTADATDAAYSRRCVPQKARLDLIYARRQSVCFDLRLMFATVFRRISLHHGKARSG